MIKGSSPSPTNNVTETGPITTLTDAVLRQEYERGYRDGHAAGLKCSGAAYPPIFWPSPIVDGDRTLGRIVTSFLVGLLLGIVTGLFIGLFVCMRSGLGPH